MTPIRFFYYPDAPQKVPPPKPLDVLVCFVFEADSPSVPLNIPKAFQMPLAQAISLGDFSGEKGESITLLLAQEKTALRLLSIGLGKLADFTSETLRRGVGNAAKELQKTNLGSAGVLLPSNVPKTMQSSLAQVCGEGLLMGGYFFDDYKETPTRERKKIHLEQVHVYDAQKASSETSMQEGVVIGEGVLLARDLGNHPSNVMTPARMVEQAEALAKRNHLKCKILDQRQLESLGMGMLLGVGQGSQNPPYLVVLEYTPSANPQGLLAFVGKGVTFDTGGISIKPSATMDEMKFDMCGAAAVFGAMESIARLKPKMRIVGVTPLCENMPSGHAIKPGDILTAYSGKRVEVLNTDAEGRLILGDALAYTAMQYKPDAIVDLATLTGACVVALGHYATGAVSNHEGFSQQVVQAGARAGEAIWPLPNFVEYEEKLKSKYADLQNIGGRDAGAITGGLFLKPFVEDIPWVHLDIAGTAWGVDNIGWAPKDGATGVGVRTLVELARSFKQV